MHKAADNKLSWNKTPRDGNIKDNLLKVIRLNKDNFLNMIQLDKDKNIKYYKDPWNIF